MDAYVKPRLTGSMLKDQSNGRLCVKKMKPYSVGSMLKDQSNGCLCVKKMKSCSVGSMLKDQSNGCSYKIKEKKTKNKEKRAEKEKSLFSVVLDKMCVFCLYLILDSQQCVKKGSYRHPILFGLLSFLVCF